MDHVVRNFQPTYIQPAAAPAEAAPSGWTGGLLSTVTSLAGRVLRALDNPWDALDRARGEIQRTLEAAINTAADPLFPVLESDGFVFGAARIQIGEETYDVLDDY